MEGKIMENAEKLTGCDPVGCEPVERDRSHVDGGKLAHKVSLSYYSDEELVAELNKRESIRAKKERIEEHEKEITKIRQEIHEMT
jgi:hypothetical protein